MNSEDDRKEPKYWKFTKMITNPKDDWSNCANEDDKSILTSFAYLMFYKKKKSIGEYAAHLQSHESIILK